MKSLSLGKPLIIVTLGYPGAGKSFFAGQFSEMFGAPVVSFDRLRYELFAEPTYSTDEYAIIQQIGLYMASELAKAQRTFIIDGGGNTLADRQYISLMAKEAGFQTLIIWVQTDVATSGQRATKRNPRKNEDKYNSSLTDDQFNTLTRQLVRPAKHEDHVVISGRHTFSTQARTVLKKLTPPQRTPSKVDVRVPIASPRPPAETPIPVTEPKPEATMEAAMPPRVPGRSIARRPETPRRRTLSIN